MAKNLDVFGEAHLREVVNPQGAVLNPAECPSWGKIAGDERGGNGEKWETKGTPHAYRASRSEPPEPMGEIFNPEGVSARLGAHSSPSPSLMHAPAQSQAGAWSGPGSAHFGGPLPRSWGQCLAGPNYAVDSPMVYSRTGVNTDLREAPSRPPADMVAAVGYGSAAALGTKSFSKLVEETREVMNRTPGAASRIQLRVNALQDSEGPSSNSEGALKNRQWMKQYRLGYGGSPDLNGSGENGETRTPEQGPWQEKAASAPPAFDASSSRFLRDTREDNDDVNSEGSGFSRRSAADVVVAQLGKIAEAGQESARLAVEGMRDAMQQLQAGHRAQLQIVQQQLEEERERSARAEKHQWVDPRLAGEDRGRENHYQGDRDMRGFDPRRADSVGIPSVQAITSAVTRTTTVSAAVGAPVSAPCLHEAPPVSSGYMMPFTTCHAGPNGQCVGQPQAFSGPLGTGGDQTMRVEHGMYGQRGLGSCEPQGPVNLRQPPVVYIQDSSPPLRPGRDPAISAAGDPVFIATQNLNSVREFDGNTSIRAWITRFEKQLKIAEPTATDKKIAYIFASKMTGFAETFYDTLEDAMKERYMDTGIGTVDDPYFKGLRSQFLDFFEGAGSGSVGQWTNIMQRRGETVANFATRMVQAQQRQLGEKAKQTLAKELLVNSFCHNLLPEVRGRVLDKAPFPTLSAAVQRAFATERETVRREHSGAVYSIDDREGGGRSAYLEVPPEHRHYEECSGEGEYYHDDTAVDVVYGVEGGRFGSAAAGPRYGSGRGSPPRTDRHEGPPRPGHPDYAGRADDKWVGGQPVCRYCGKTGHYVRRCPERFARLADLDRYKRGLGPIGSRPTGSPGATGPLTSGSGEVKFHGPSSRHGEGSGIATIVEFGDEVLVDMAVVDNRDEATPSILEVEPGKGTILTPSADPHLTELRGIARPVRLANHERYGRIYAEVKVNGRNTIALVDTGAIVSLMDEQLARGITNSAEWDRSPVELSSATHHQLDMMGSVVVKLRIAGQDFRHQMYICKGLGRDMLLGDDFLQAARCEVSYNPKRRFLVGGKEVKCKTSRTWIGGSSIMEIGFSGPGLIRPHEMRNIVVPLKSLPTKVRKQLQEGDMVIIEPKPTRIQGNREEDPWDDERGPEEDPWEGKGEAPEEEPLEAWLPRCVAHVRDEQLTLPAVNPYGTEVRLPTGNDIMVVEKLVPDLTSLEEILPPPHKPADKAELARSREAYISRLKKIMQRYPYPKKVPGVSMEGSMLTAEEQALFQYALSTVGGVFAETDMDLGTTKLVEHSINTKDAPPMRQRPYRVPFKFREQMEKLLDDMLKQGVVEPSNSPWASPVVLVRKHDGTLRFCVDYRRLNEVTRKDSYPLPRIDELLDSMNGAQIFSKMDLQHGFWQIPLDPDARAKTAFTCHEGLFQFKHMPFGLTNAPATFQRLMDCVLSGLNGIFCLVFLDDIIIFTTTTPEQHLFDVLRVLRALKSAGLKVKGRKCSFARDKLQFLGHEVSCLGIRPDPEKIKAVLECPPPKNQTGVRSFLGLTGFYRRFIFEYACIVFPLVALLKKGVAFKWTGECQKAFDALKDALTRAPILVYPSLQKPFLVETDASGEGLGAVLSQEGDDGQMHVVAYASRTLRKYELHYSSLDSELLAVVWALSHFRPYLLGAPFRILTDHEASVWLLKKQFSSAMGYRRTRWAVLLSEYDFTIAYRPGKQNGNADALSRAPIVRAVKQNDAEEFDPAEYNNCGEEGTAELGYEVGGQIVPTVAPELTGSLEEEKPQTLASTEAGPVGQEDPEQPAKRTIASEETSVMGAIKERPPSSPSSCGLDPQLLLDALSAMTDTTVVTAEEYNRLLTTPDRYLCRGPLSVSKAAGLDDGIGCAAVSCFQFPMTSREQMAEDQGADPFCGPLLDYKLRSEVPQDENLAREVHSCCNSYVVNDGLLYRVSRVNSKSTDGDGSARAEQLVVPRKSTDVLIASYHSGLGGGHFGPAKLFQTISRRYFWKNCYEDIRNFCRTCTICGKYNDVQRTKARLYPLKVHGPFERIEVDFEGPLTETPTGNKYIIVFTDCFTKWPIATAVPDATAETSARAFMKHVVLQHGCPLELLSDKGPAFRAVMCERICNKLGVHKTFSMPYHHQTVGQVERLNKSLLEMLRKSLDQEPEGLWDEHLPYALFAYRVAVHTTTRDTPFHMLYGRDPTLPVDLLMQSLTQTEEEDGGYPEQVQEHMQRAWDRARENIAGAQERMADYYDRNVVDDRVKVGNLVRRKVHVARNRNPKFAARYEGMYRVQKIHRNNAKLQPWGKGHKHQLWLPLVDLKVYRGNWNHPAPELREEGVVERDETHRQMAQCPTCGVHGYDGQWVQCDHCRRWYHFECVGMTEVPMEDECWYCDACMATDLEREALSPERDSNEAEEHLESQGVGDNDETEVNWAGPAGLGEIPVSDDECGDSNPRTVDELVNAVVTVPCAVPEQGVPVVVREEEVPYCNESVGEKIVDPLQEPEPRTDGAVLRSSAASGSPERMEGFGGGSGEDQGQALRSPAVPMSRPLPPGMTRHRVRLTCTPKGVSRHSVRDHVETDDEEGSWEYTQTLAGLEARLSQ